MANSSKKRNVANRIAILLLSVLVMLLLLDVLSAHLLRNITNLEKLLIYVVIFIIPIIVYLRVNKYKSRKMLKLHHVKVKYLPFIVLFGISTSVICALINAGTNALFSGLGIESTVTSTVSFASDSLFVIVVTMVFMPAFCEELLIRGVALTEYSKYGVSVSVLMTSVIFALFHGSPFTLPSLFVAGLLYGVMTHLFMSIWPSFICHFINNAIAVFIGYNSDYVKYLFSDSLFVIIIVALLLAILYVTLKLLERVLDQLGTKKRLKTNTRKLVYGEPLGSLYIWLFFAISIFIAVRRFL